MAMTAAARSGVGLIALASVPPVTDAVASQLPECMLQVLPACSRGGISWQGAALVARELTKATACLCGCGLGLGAHSRLLVRELVKSCLVPMVLDADALNILSEAPEIMLSARAPIIITPHHGEMGRLIHGQVTDPAAAACNFAKKYHVTVILKGSLTVVADQGGSVFMHDLDNSGLAKGGSGDVLAGIVAGLLAQGMDPAKAACLAVYIHGEGRYACAAVAGREGDASE